jgi:hypothetical protein
MKSSKFQAPASREIPMSKHQTTTGASRVTTACACSWSLRLGASLLLGSWCLVLLLSQQVSAQSYTVDWFKVAGGGGTSTGGTYQVSGTIGQPDAGTMSRRNYSLTGGFWSIFAVQMTGSPFLRIFLTTTNTVVLAWPAPSTGFSLQQSLDLGTANWLAVTNIPSVFGGEKQIILSPQVGNKYFRLSNP